MRILFISGSLPPIKDGVGDYSAKLLRILAKENKIDVLSSVKCDGAANEEFILEKWSLAQVLILRRIINFTKYDIVHIQYPSNVYKRYLLINIIPFLAKLNNPKIKVITTIHNYYRHYTILGKLRLYLLLIKTDHIVTVSQKIKDYFSEIPVIKNKPCSVIRIGSNFNFLSQSKSNTPKISSTVNIGYFGFLNPTKKIENIIEGLKLLAESNYSFIWHFICEIDKKNQYHNKIINLINDSGLQQYAKFYNYLVEGELNKVLTNMDLMILFYKDGIDINKSSFLASIQCGIPVITIKSDTPLPNEIKNYSNCFILDNMEPESIKFAYEEILKNGNYLNISKNARSLAKKFSWPEISNQHNSLYTSQL